MRRLEAREVRLDAVDADREAADPVAGGIDEIGQAHVGAALALGDLLAQERRSAQWLSSSRWSDRRRRRRGGTARGRRRRARSATSRAMIWSSIACASANSDARAFADHLVRRGSRDNCRPAPRRGRTASSRCSSRRSARSQSAKTCTPGLRRRGRLQRHVGLERVGARLVERQQLALRPCRRARRAPPRIRRRSSRRSRRGCVSLTSVDATPTARLASSTWTTGPVIGRRDAQRGVDLATSSRRRSAAASSCPARFISSATVTISSSDGVIRPDRPIMSASFSFAAFEDLRPRHHHAEIDHLEAVALQHDADDVLADVVDVALDGRHDDLALAACAPGSFAASMKGSRCATAFFITRADFTTCGRNILPEPNRSPTTFMPSISGPSITSIGRANSRRRFLGILDDIVCRCP